jgi:hypothetical protein
MPHRSTSRSLSLPYLVAPTLCPVVGSFGVVLGLVHCGGGGGGSDPSGADATLDVTTTDVDGGVVTDSSQTDSAATTDASDVVDTGIPCDASNGCPGAMECCANRCSDLARDPRNCGACGNACSATQFCTGTLCDDAVFANICASKSVTVVDDPYPTDMQAGSSLGEAIGSSCAGAGVTVVMVSQTQPGILVQGGDAGWRPNTGVGTTLVAGGGAFGQLSVQYMDESALTPVYLTNNGTTSHIYQRSTGLPLVTANDDTLSAQHDFFMLELAVEPQSGTLCLFGEGILGPGTVAAGYFGSHVLLPAHASYPAAWYVYEWTDTNGDMTPDSGDAFHLVAQGP